MKIIAGSRGGGVTTDLILEAAKYKGVIIAISDAQAIYIQDLAKKLCDEDVSVFTVQDVINGKLRGHGYTDRTRVYVSDFGIVLGGLLASYGAPRNIETASISLEKNDKTLRPEYFPDNEV